MRTEENCCNDTGKDFLKRFQGTIKKSLSQTALQEREDLEQELYIKIFEKTKNLSFRENAPSFWELLRKNH